MSNRPRHAGCGLVLSAMLCVLFVGCSKVNDSSVGILQAAASGARERAMSFELIRPLLAAKVAANQAAAEKFFQYHADGLQAQAKGLDDIVKALTADRTIREATAKALQDAADTAAARVENMKLAGGMITAKGGAAADVEKVALWAVQHIEALGTQAMALRRVAETFKPKQKEEAK